MNPLQQLVDKYDINVSAMARKVGLSLTSMYAILRGGTPKVQTAIKVVRYINTTYAEKTSVEELWGYLVKEDGK